jgi:hypothetical protein
VSENNSQRFFALLKLLLVMKPCQVLRSEDHEPLLHLLVRFIALLGQHATLDNSIRILKKLISNLFDYKALLGFRRDLILAV